MAIPAASNGSVTALGRRSTSKSVLARITSAKAKTQLSNIRYGAALEYPQAMASTQADEI
ncbi:hypothetical protein GCM10008941_04680 [Rhizomicrobium palustre]